MNISKQNQCRLRKTVTFKYSENSIQELLHSNKFKEVWKHFVNDKVINRIHVHRFVIKYIQIFEKIIITCSCLNYIIYVLCIYIFIYILQNRLHYLFTNQ